ncbi:MAG: hypothetical protein J5865_02800 [Lachnospiraceae bacterium]|nr:hypothetical protein [Lachnospiraceae bacterium]
MKHIDVIDRTLPELDKDLANTLLFREKAAFVSTIESFGVDRIELPAIRNKKEDTVICKTLAASLKNCAVSMAVDGKAGNVEEAWEAVKCHPKAMLTVELPVSTVRMEYQLHLKEDALLARISQLVGAAAALCGNAEFCAQDAGRADAAFLDKAIKTALEAGAAQITLCEDAGDKLPEEVAGMVAAVKGKVNVPVFVRLSNGSGLAVANALAAIRAGADGVVTAVSGTAVLNTEAFSDAMKVFGGTLEAECGLNGTLIHSDIRKMSGRQNRLAPGTQSAVEMTDAAAIYLDTESSIEQVKAATALLGYELSDQDLGAVYDAVIGVCKKKHSIEGKELEAVIASTALQVPSTYHLENYLISSSNITASMAQVKLNKEGEILEGVASGDGPIDAAFNAIDNGIGHHYELDDLQIQAVTEGKSALGAALVRLRSDGKLYSGNGLSTDIVGASVRAYINALNKIVFEEM